MRTRTRSAGLALLILLAASVPVAGAERGEICRFRALDPENPFRRWLASPELTCVAANAPLKFPEGWWNVFVRADGAISSAPLLVDGNGAPPSIAPTLVPAATLAALLPEGRAGVVYLPRRGSAFPIDSARVSVPADEPLWLFVLDATTPVALIPVAPIAKGVETRVDARSGGPAAVVGWLQMPEAERNALETTTGVVSPAIRAGSREADLLPPPALLHGAFYRVRDVAPGNADVRLEGRGWVADRRVVNVQPGLTVAAVPLVVRASGTLVVHWNTDQDLVALDLSVGACAEPEPPRIVIAVSKCIPPRPGTRAEPDCTLMREEKVDRFFGSMTLDDVAPGAYRAEMRYGKLPPMLSMGSVAPLRVSDLRIFATYFTVHGGLTHGGEPLGEEATLRFPSGIGFADAASGDYRAVLRTPGLGRDARIEVAACDGAPRAVILTDEGMRPGTRHNLDIPANDLIVRVTDTFTREALVGASVKLEVLSMRGDPVFTVTQATDENGELRWTSVPVRELHLTATHPGYEKRVVPTFTMQRSGEQFVEVQLVPARGTRGRIESERELVDAMVVWYAPDGTETERADVSPDGTFIFANRHTADETLSVVSSSHPLWVLRAPATESREMLALRFPPTPPVSVDVWLATPVPQTETRYLTVAIGGLRVPQPVLAHHQTLRRHPPLLRGSGPHPLRDLLPTGPIDILLGPTTDELPTTSRPRDVFALPQFANVPRTRVRAGEGDVVVSDER